MKDYSALVWSFVIIHLFLYPASNAYNSYFDKDESSIGILRRPPPVSRALYYTSLLFDLIAIILGWWVVNVQFALMLTVYGVISKAYSHPLIRLKKFPILSWMVVVVFQGVFTMIMCYMGINDVGLLQSLRAEVVYGGCASTLLLFASYPLTQVYQHEEDGKRGDRTISMLLGVRGTFLFALLSFCVAIAAFEIYFMKFFSTEVGVIFMLSLTPVVLSFVIWYARVLRDESRANFSWAMWLTFISSLCLNCFFLWLHMSPAQAGFRESVL